MLTRRHILSSIGAAGLAAAMPRLALAAAPGDRRFVLVILRGALDGLAAVPAYGDGDYKSLRGALAIAEPGQKGADGSDGALDLGGRFGLHPALAPLHDFYKRGEMLVVHATAGHYRGRSHFDAQDMLESGVAVPHGSQDGWLNRALAAMPGAASAARNGLALGQTVPLALRGKVPVASWAPSDLPEVEPGLMQTVAALYRNDRLLGPALAEGLKGQSFADQVMNDGQRMNQPPGPGRQQFLQTAAAGGKLMAPDNGARVAVLDVGGWDTHANQGAARGRLALVLQILAEGMVALRDGLGPAWDKTVVLVATEFGRTVQVNGTGGTDHGTGGVAFLLGGAVAGGRVVADWPGLSPAKLFEGRDLMPTTDLRAVAKAVLIDHLRLPAASVDAQVFPSSAAVKPMAKLVRV
ncbi:MAG: DUF1501 domain-containing protein [Alphaproteobacteria bacterium]|nr:DUF1501 domain-containing protein [Alphaproteobacteria bacterium]